MRLFWVHSTDTYTLVARALFIYLPSNKLIDVLPRQRQFLTRLLRDGCSLPTPTSSNDSQVRRKRLNFTPDGGYPGFSCTLARGLVSARDYMTSRNNIHESYQVVLVLITNMLTQNQISSSATRSNWDTYGFRAGCTSSVRNFSTCRTKKIHHIIG